MSSDITNLTANLSSSDEIPEELTEIRVIPLFLYSLLFAIGGPANLTRLIMLITHPNRKSPFFKLITHLVIADLIVTFIMIPTEIIWRITNIWMADDYTCKILQMTRAFGLYLSSAVLVCITFDRYYAVAHPLSIVDAHSRINKMLAISWLLSFILCIPQVRLII